MTPSYLDVEDVTNFHQSYKTVCDKHDPEYFTRFKVSYLLKLPTRVVANFLSYVLE